MTLAFFPLIATIGLSLAQGFMSYRSQQAQADAMAQQAEVDRASAREQMRIDEQKKTDEIMRLREKQRHRRSAIEAAYASSGVVMDGSAEEILVRQREADELNAQRKHWGVNRQKQLDNWSANQNYAQAMAQSKSLERAANVGLFTSVAKAGVQGVGLQSDYGFNKFSWGMKGASKAPKGGSSMWWNL